MYRIKQLTLCALAATFGTVAAVTYTRTATQVVFDDVTSTNVLTRTVTETDQALSTTTPRLPRIPAS
ncbi:hypothetical protein OBBRIDRAFT_839814 [Obba rivulosa]|uniref:Uncharacterized protein n=1 Tax=Obba rivulosa TaxID=1052685 RepID=A0A8E2AJ00_9APHY|nr:hypothetical protein OBBRIDRAFT_839814 [Obba rivulosa]